MNLDVQRAEIIRQLFATDSPEVLKKVQRTLKNALKALQTEEKEETEYISKEEVMDGIREGLTEMFRAQRMGIKQKTLQELIDILKQKYEYSFELQTDSISNIVYNIVLEQESLEEILNDITVITPQVHYSINYGTRTVIIR